MKAREMLTVPTAFFHAAAGAGAPYMHMPAWARRREEEVAAAAAEARLGRLEQLLRQYS